MSKHTPGPWGISDKAAFEIRRCDENGIARLDLIADVACLNTRTPWANNARLIAAAPDLLDALRRVMRHIPADAGGCSLADDLHRARAAIARAEE